MSTQRDELALEIFIADNSAQPREESTKDWAAYTMATSQTYAHNIADGLIAAGYAKPRTITTAEGLDALPIGSVVASVEAYGLPGGHVYPISYQRIYTGRWHRGGRQRDTHPDNILPATVLYEPTA